MISFDESLGWIRGHVIMGHKVTENRASNAKVKAELMENGCSEELALRLAIAALIALKAIDKMMEKSNEQ